LPVAQQGVPGFEAVAWWGVFATAGTPQPIVQRMHDELAKALKVPAVAERLTGQGMTLRGGTPDELQKFLVAEIARWGKVVKDNNIKSGD
jgi:tripartite-type tricarboxylate transporter receptor subunit TctC